MQIDTNTHSTGAERQWYCFSLTKRFKVLLKRFNYLSKRYIANSGSIFNPFKSRRSLHLWNAAPRYIIRWSRRRLSANFVPRLFFCFDVAAALDGNRGIVNFGFSELSSMMLFIPGRRCASLWLCTVLCMRMGRDWQSPLQEVKAYRLADRGSIFSLYRGL